MAELPWWTHFQRPTWKIAMRLRCGLLVTPAIQSDSIPTPIFTIKLEQFIYELAQFDENTGETTEARIDTVADTGNF